MRKPVPCEVWCRSRFVAAVPRFIQPDGRSASAAAGRGRAQLRQ
jgi:hypothetical protein